MEHAALTFLIAIPCVVFAGLILLTIWEATK